MYKPEPFYVLEPVDYHESALTMRVVGWVLIVVGAMVDGLFVFQGLRDGSLLFPVWATVQTLAGLFLVGAGIVRDEKATIMEGMLIPLNPVPDKPRFDERPPRAA
jgi:hypothetical protein